MFRLFLEFNRNLSKAWQIFHDIAKTKVIIFSYPCTLNSEYNNSVIYNTTDHVYSFSWLFEWSVFDMYWNDIFSYEWPQLDQRLLRSVWTAVRFTGINNNTIWIDDEHFPHKNTIIKYSFWYGRVHIQISHPDFFVHSAEFRFGWVIFRLNTLFKQIFPDWFRRSLSYRLLREPSVDSVGKWN